MLYAQSVQIGRKRARVVSPSSALSRNSFTLKMPSSTASTFGAKQARSAERK